MTVNELFENTVVPGDLNGDGDINSTDSVLLLRELAGMN